MLLPARISLVLLLVLGACRQPGVTQLQAEPARVSPASLDFGRTWVGHPERRTLELFNPNKTALAIALSTAEPFALVEAPGEIPGESSVVATLEFHPTQAGPVAGAAAVGEQRISLSGEGEEPFACAAATACVATAFSPDAGTCLSTPRPDGTDCTASNTCFRAAQCERGECVGTLTTCDDGNACTVDVCGERGCTHIDGFPRCPVPADPCRVATCDADAGCGAGTAPDGTPCGASTCTQALVCIGGACVQRVPPAGQPCIDAACRAAGVTCGALNVDGGVVRCGICAPGEVCDAKTRHCVSPQAACAAHGTPCGTTVDACGLTVTCPNTCVGTCLGTTCGPVCVPKTCAQQGAACGVIGDGCANILCCGVCTAPSTCGGGGVPWKCEGAVGCVPRTCADVGANCGPMSDGCGGLLNCGSCGPPATCGGGGVNSRCGEQGTNISDAGSPCPPTTCAMVNAECGPIYDGCGGIIQCGACTAPGICGGDGVPNVCPLQAECGTVQGESLNTVFCGGCPPGTTCGGGGVPYRCGVGLCRPLSCAEQGIVGGLAGDGCGGVISCGTPQFCASSRHRTCARSRPLACQQLGLDCGVIQSACGPSVDCGTCPAPQVCQNNRCSP